MCQRLASKKSLFQKLSIVVQTRVFRGGEAPPGCRSRCAKGHCLSRDGGKRGPSECGWEDGAAGVSEPSPAPRRTHLLRISLGNHE